MKKYNFLSVFFLSCITFGIYSLAVMLDMANNNNRIASKTKSQAKQIKDIIQLIRLSVLVLIAGWLLAVYFDNVVLFQLIALPVGIIALIWSYTFCKQQCDILKAYGQNVAPFSHPAVLLVTQIVPVYGWYVLCKNYNTGVYSYASLVRAICPNCGMKTNLCIAFCNECGTQLEKVSYEKNTSQNNAKKNKVINVPRYLKKYDFIKVSILSCILFGIYFWQVLSEISIQGNLMAEVLQKKKIVNFGNAMGLAILSIIAFIVSGLATENYSFFVIAGIVCLGLVPVWLAFYWKQQTEIMRFLNIQTNPHDACPVILLLFMFIPVARVYFVCENYNNTARGFETYYWKKVYNSERQALESHNIFVCPSCGAHSNTKYGNCKTCDENLKNALNADALMFE